MLSWKSAVGSTLALGITALLWGSPPASKSKTLDIYFIDVEGGQSTLLVTPEGGSFLIDTGYRGYDSEHPDVETGRDAQRVLHAAKDAGIKRIDTVLATHDHPDHMGGIYEIQKLIPTGTLIDHGPSAEDRETLNVRAGGYPLEWLEALQHSQHRVVHAGDKIDVKGLDDVTVVLAMDLPIDRRGPANPYCAKIPPEGNYTTWGTRGAEDRFSAGVVVQFGKFVYSNIGDNSDNQEIKLLCPENKAGIIDVWETPVHGRPPTVALPAVEPRVAVMDNAARKLGTGVKQFSDMPTHPDLWMLHLNLADNAVNAPESSIANLAERLPEDKGYFLKLSAKKDGSFTIFNERNGHTKAYPPRGGTLISSK